MIQDLHPVAQVAAVIAFPAIFAGILWIAALFIQESERAPGMQNIADLLQSIVVEQERISELLLRIQRATESINRRQSQFLRIDPPTVSAAARKEAKL